MCSSRLGGHRSLIGNASLAKYRGGIVGTSLLLLCLLSTAASGQSPKNAVKVAMPTVVAPAAIPVGSIIAYGGDLKSLPSEYLPCDGREFDQTSYRALWVVLGTAWGAGHSANSGLLPKLDGLFLRGADPRSNVDKDGTSRTAPAAGGNVGANGATLENWATGLPRAPFTTGPESNSHDHAASTDAEYISGPNTFSAGKQRGLGVPGVVTLGPNDRHHTHVLVGGDTETRPVNASVYWIIRVR